MGQVVAYSHSKNSNSLTLARRSSIASSFRSVSSVYREPWGVMARLLGDLKQHVAQREWRWSVGDQSVCIRSVGLSLGCGQRLDGGPTEWEKL